MQDLVHYGRQLLILIFFPFLGIVLEIGLSSKIIRVISIATLVLLAPLLTGYNYVLTDLYRILTLILLACTYSFFSRQIQNQSLKFMSALLTSGLLLAILGYAFFIDTMGGSQVTLKKWKLDGYQIEYIKDQGFAGRPLMKYELSKLTTIPIFIKKIETIAEDDSTKICDIIFDRNKIVFNKCSGTLQNGR